MCSRLVVGSGSFVQDLVSLLADEPGDLTAVSNDDRYVETFQNSDQLDTVLDSDPTNEKTYAHLGQSIDSVVIAGTDTHHNAEIARAVRAAFPDAFIMAYAVGNTDHSDIPQSVDTVFEPAQEIAREVLGRIDGVGQRLYALRRTLTDCETMAVIMHDNPDPDAIASGIALARVAESFECSVDVCYYGSISHQENRAFVNLLDLDLYNLADDEDISTYDTIALVDHSRPGVNDQLPPETEIDIVIDHHPPRAPVKASFVDLRSDMGATSTLLVDYLKYFNVELDETVATALLFGIRIDTDEFTREVSAHDFTAAAYLLSKADLNMLERIESPSMTPETLSVIADAIHNRSQHGTALLSFVGRMSDRDALAQAADRLLNMEAITTTLVYGLIDGTIYISARARGTDLDLGEALREAFGQIGSAGGHADMAGAQIELGLLESIDDNNESLLSVVEEIITDRFLDVIESHPQRYTAVFQEDAYMLDNEDMPFPPLEYYRPGNEDTKTHTKRDESNPTE